VSLDYVSKQEGELGGGGYGGAVERLGETAAQACMREGRPGLS
jgi:hypothetical protein